MIIQVHKRNRNEVIEWLEQHVSPVRYYLHTKLGGYGWSLRAAPLSSIDNPYYELEMENSEMATLVALKFS